MKLLSVNVSLPREVEWKGRIVRTSIFKAPVSGRVRVRKLNVDGDQQSDLTVHGGVDKAVYVYPSEHYGFWRDALPAAMPFYVWDEAAGTVRLMCSWDTTAEDIDELAGALDSVMSDVG